MRADWDGCAAYPNYDIALPLTIDLVRGKDLDWNHFFVDGFQESQGDKPSPLTERYLKQAKLDPDCGQAVSRSDTSFDLWLDQDKNGLVAKPDLPHVVAACAKLVVIPFSELKGSIRDPLDRKDLVRP